MNFGVRIGIGAALVAVAAGGGYFYAQSVATARAEDMVENIRAQMPPGTTLAVDGLSASPFGSARVDGFTLTALDGTLEAGASEFAGGEGAIDLVDISDVTLLADGDTIRVDRILARNVVHPDFARLGLTLQGRTGGYADPVEALRGLDLESFDLTGMAITESGGKELKGRIDSLTVADLTGGELGALSMSGVDIADTESQVTLDGFRIAAVEVADAMATALSGASRDDIIAATRYGAYDLTGLTVTKDGANLLSVDKVAMADPVHVGDLLMAADFVVEGMRFDVRDSMDVDALAQMRAVLGEAADGPIEMSLTMDTTYDAGLLTLEDMTFETRDLGTIQVSAAVSNFTVDEAAVTNPTAEAMQAALLEAFLGSTPTDVHLHVTHTGWVHEAMRLTTGSPQAAAQQAAMFGMIAGAAVSPLAGQEGAKALADGVGQFLTEKTNLTLSAVNSQKMAVRDVAAAGGGGAVALTVETR